MALITHQDYLVEGISQKDLDEHFRLSDSEFYITESTRVYHAQNSTFIVPLLLQRGFPLGLDQSHQGMFKLLTEQENVKEAIKWVKEITRREVREKE